MEHSKLLSSLNDPERLHELYTLNLLDTASDEAFDRLSRLASRILKTPVVLVSLVDRDRQFFKSQIGLADPWATLRQTPLSHSFCQHAVASRSPLVIEDARQHPLVQDNLAIRDLGVIAYAGIPMITSNNHAIGSFCVIDNQPRAWTPEEIEILQDLAASVMTEIELRRENALRQRTADYLEIQHAVAQALLSDQTVEAALSQIGKIIVEKLDWAMVDSSIISEDINALRYCGGWQNDSFREFGRKNNQQTFRFGEGLAGRTWAGSKPIWIEDIATDPNFVDSDGAFQAGLRAAIGIPMWSPDGVIGVLCCFSTRTSPPDTQMMEVLLAVGNQTGQYLHRQQTEARLMQEFEFRAALHQIALDLFNRREQDDVLQAIVEDAAAFLDAPYGELMLKEDSDTMVVRAFTRNQPFLLGDRATRESATLSWKAHDTRQPVILADYQSYSPHRPIYDTSHITSVADFPIMVAGECRGVLALGRSVPDHPFTDEQIQKGVLFSQLAAIVIDNVDLYAAALREINERKQAEVALRESQRLNERILNLAPAAIYLRDTTNQRMIFSNPQMAELLGISPEEVVTLDDATLISLIHPDDLSISIESYARLFVLPSGANDDIEYRIRRPNGEWIWVNNRTSIFNRNDQAGHVEFLVIAQDITERKHAEAALRESQRLTERILNTAPAAIYLRDVINERMVFNNPQTADILGESPEALATLTNSELLSRVHPDDSASSISYYTSLAMQPEGETAELEYRIRRTDGSWAWLNNHVTIFDRDDQAGSMSLLVIAQDVTERKRAELSLGALIDQLTTLHRVDAEVGSTLRIQHVLETAVEVSLEYSLAKHAFIGLLEQDEDQQYWLNVAHGAGGYAEGKRFNVTQGIISKAIAEHRPLLVRDVSQEPVYIPYIPGTRAQISIPLMVRSQLIGLLNLETDTPEDFSPDVFDFLNLMMSRIAAAVENARLYQVSQTQLAELQQLYDRVSGLEQLKTDMIRIAAHDLRNPLGIVRGYLELLKEDAGDVLTDQHKGFIANINRALDRMNTITTDILSLQRIEAAAENAALEQFDFTALVKAVIQEYTEQAAQKDQSFTIILPEQSTPVFGDSPQLHEATSNLIGNAIKYTPVGGSITVHMAVTGQSLRFEVRDTGVGVPESMQARLFQPFFRAKTHETAEINGTGLGLHLVKNIIERHNGSMFFTSIYQQGSTFGFKLPLTSAPS